MSGEQEVETPNGKPGIDRPAIIPVELVDSCLLVVADAATPQPPYGAA